MLPVLVFHVTLFSLLVYCLAFFAVALAVMLSRSHDSQLPLTRSLVALAVFAVLQGLMELMNISALFHSGGFGTNLSWLMRSIKAVLLGTSYLSLIYFGVDLLARLNPRHRWLRWLVLLLAVLWLGTSFAQLYLHSLPATAFARYSTRVAGYMLVLPGGLLATWGLIAQKQSFNQLGLPAAAKNCLPAGIALFGYSLVTGVFDSQMPSPTSVRFYNVEMQVAVYLIVQTVQAALAIGIALHLLRITQAYRDELRGRVRLAEEERCLAQAETLAAHERAEQQLRESNEALERRVRLRTAELEARRAEADALYDIGAEMLALRDLPVILRSVANFARELLRADVATLSMLNPDGSDTWVEAVSGDGISACHRRHHGADHPLVGKAIATGEAAVTVDYADDASGLHGSGADASGSAENARGHLVAPIKVGDRVIGALHVSSRGERHFSADEAWLLTRLTLATAVAVQNGRLYEQSQQVAVLTERERLSREIHDGLAQALGCIAMISRAAQERLQRAEVARVQVDLVQMERHAEEAYRDAREAILGLRVNAGGGLRLLPALREYISQFGELCGIEVALSVSEDWPANILPEIESQVMRIVQEALSNVRKHAAARGVAVSMETSGDWLQVVVQDDGRGFVVSNAANGNHYAGRDHSPGQDHHFGLHTMRERATAIGAIMIVESAPGQGTRVVLRLPNASADPAPEPAAGVTKVVGTAGEVTA